jgi:hypothetical protein
LANALRETMGLGIPREEAKFVVPLYRKLRRIGDLENPANLRRLVQSILRTGVFVFMRNAEGIQISEEEIIERVKEPSYAGVLYATFQLLAEKKGKPTLAYKNPTDLVHMPLLARLLPTARFIHIVRDGRDVVGSLLRMTWGPNTPYAAARFWRSSLMKGMSDGRAMPERYFEFRMEDLVTDTHKTATDLGNFINQGRNPEEITRLVEWIGRKKDANKIYLWKQKMDPKQRYICEAVAGDMLRGCGYQVEFEGGAKISPLKAFYYRGADMSLRIKNRLVRKPKHWQLPANT